MDKAPGPDDPKPEPRIYDLPEQASIAFADALDWERHCKMQSGPVTWADMANAADLMVRIAAIAGAAVEPD
jgi:hypothetical protein